MVPIWGEMLLGLAVSAVIVWGWLLPRGLLLRENLPIVFWMLVLPNTFAIRLIHGLPSKNVKVGKVMVGRNLRTLILAMVLALLGFMLGGGNGAFVGVLAGGVISGVVGYSWNRLASKRGRAKRS
jgi:hypothetical protein